ncbi:hypothetical protein ACFL2E_01815 [Thermodesulfobacteriota bacterium]
MKMKRHKVRILLLSAVVLILSSFQIMCSKNDRPSEALMKSDLETIFNSNRVEDEPVYEFVSVSKTNGMDKGNSNYQLEYTGRVEALRDVYVWMNGKTYPWNTDLGDVRVIEKGGEREYLGVSIYELTEKGWRLDVYEISIADGLKISNY